MQERRVDIAIIGAGSAGLGAYSAARAHTDSVVMIESGPYGTTCARVGCMPSKLLIAAADAAHHARDAGAFGVNIDGNIRIDGREVMARVKRERDHFVDGVLESIEGIDADQRLRGHATFEHTNTLIIDDHTRIHAERIVIATGSSPDYPDFLKAAGDRGYPITTSFTWTTCLNQWPYSVRAWSVWSWGRHWHDWAFESGCLG